MSDRYKIVRIGAGAGFSGDRIEPAVELMAKAHLDYLVFECLAERTIALAHQSRRQNSEAGYDPLLLARMRAVLPGCMHRGVRIVSNMGAANPLAAAHRIADVAREFGLQGLRIAAVTGDDVLSAVLREDPELLGRPGRVTGLGPERIVSANAYLGAPPIVEALEMGAQVVITGRVADPSLFLAPLVHEFGWREDDWTMLGRGALVGHLLECAGQLTGGYFADPGVKDVPDLARLGFPFAEVAADGSATFTKVEGSGGRLDLRTVKEQLLYELGDPSAYLTPDVCADFSRTVLCDLGPNRVRASAAGGSARPANLKVSVGYLDGYVGEGQISYAGLQAADRGRLALEIVRERLRLTGIEAQELRCELIGVDSVRLGAGAARGREASEVRARIAARTVTLEAAQRVGAEVETLYTNGPAGGGGAARSATAIVAIASTLIPRSMVTPQVEMVIA
ncbi:MAG TPA: acyclic terpene utilization AtuA family protein [Caulobacteraceae bacterium]|nr:acyclic terpene utilization AtuA family protein [Caulobacteraceae bacterium]